MVIVRYIEEFGAFMLKQAALCDWLKQEKGRSKILMKLHTYLLEMNS